MDMTIWIADDTIADNLELSCLGFPDPEHDGFGWTDRIETI